MRKIALMVCLMIMTAAGSGCGPGGNTRSGGGETAESVQTTQGTKSTQAAQETGRTQTTQGTESMIAEETTAAGTAGTSGAGTKPAAGTEATAAPSQETSGETAANVDNNMGVIAKSGNDVSSADKEALLKQLDDQLDSLFSSLGRLEDVRDEVLEPN